MAVQRILYVYMEFSNDNKGIKPPFPPKIVFLLKLQQIPLRKFKTFISQSSLTTDAPLFSSREAFLQVDIDHGPLALKNFQESITLKPNTMLYKVAQEALEIKAKLSDGCYGGLNETGPHRPLESGTIRGRGLGGVGVALLEGVPLGRL